MLTKFETIIDNAITVVALLGAIALTLSIPCYIFVVYFSR